VRYEYFEWDPRAWERMFGFEQLRKLFHYLVTATAGDVQQALEILERLKRQGYLPADTDLGQFRRDLQEREEIERDVEGKLGLTARGERVLRRTALEQVFGKLKRRGTGDHRTPREGRGGEQTSETRAWRFGDDVGDVDFRRSYQNAMRRAGLERLHLAEEDLEVAETEQHTSCATVLLLDISHSMILYGEDRITPAKQVALALVELIRTKFPKDSIDVVLFGNEAFPVRIEQLPYVQVGPFHTNTRAALQTARKILRRRKHANKQVILITDGKPTVITDEEGVIYRNTFGLDPKIVAKTLDEAVALRREHVPITTFMIASDPYLQQFVHRLTELNRGKAYFSEAGNLGEFVLVDFVRNRRGKLRG
jgi:Ca-activated chloride channel homolog